MMAIDAPVRNPWTIAPHVGVNAHWASAPTGSRVIHGAPGSATCPVCRRAHPGRLVRRLVIDGIAPPPVASRSSIPPAPPARYLPPAVPVLSPESQGPIGRSARWSVAVA